jgi:hypothetical protein
VKVLTQFFIRSDKDQQPCGIIPLENVVVKPREEKKKVIKITLTATDGGPIKSCKFEKGTVLSPLQTSSSLSFSFSLSLPPSLSLSLSHYSSLVIL